MTCSLCLFKALNWCYEIGFCTLRCVLSSSVCSVSLHVCNLPRWWLVGLCWFLFCFLDPFLQIPDKSCLFILVQRRMDLPCVLVNGLSHSSNCYPADLSQVDDVAGQEKPEENKPWLFRIVSLFLHAFALVLGGKGMHTETLI